MRFCALYKDIKTPGDLNEPITRRGARDGCTRMNVTVASLEARAGSSAAWTRCASEDGLQLTGEPKGPDFGVTLPITGGIMLRQTFPLSLFPEWKAGDASP